MLVLATQTLLRLNLSHDRSQAKHQPDVHTGRRNPERGKPVGSENFNGRALAEFLQELPELPPALADGETEDAAAAETRQLIADAHAGAVVLHATLADRLPDVWAKLKAAIDKGQPLPEDVQPLM